MGPKMGGPPWGGQKWGPGGQKSAQKKGYLITLPFGTLFWTLFLPPFFGHFLGPPKSGPFLGGFRGYPGGQYPDGSLPAHYTDCKLQSADDMTVSCHEKTTVSRQVSGIFAALRPAHPPRHTARAVQERRGVGGQKNFRGIPLPDRGGWKRVRSASRFRPE